MERIQIIYVRAKTFLSELVWGRDAPLMSSSRAIDLELQLAETQPPILSLPVNQETSQPSTSRPSSPATDLELRLPETQPQVLSPAVNRDSTPQPQQPLSVAINEQQINTESAVNQISSRWAKIVMAFCFTAALEIDLKYEQIDQHSKPNPKFYLRSLCIALTFVSLIVSQLISKMFPLASRRLEKVAISLGVTAFFIIIAHPLMAMSLLNDAT